jgi:hypothetical protein
MKYMLLLNRTGDALAAPGTPEFGRTMQEYGAAVEAMGRAGVLIDCMRRSRPATRPRPAPSGPTGARSHCSTAS